MILLPYRIILFAGASLIQAAPNRFFIVVGYVAGFESIDSRFYLFRQQRLDSLVSRNVEAEDQLLDQFRALKGLQVKRLFQNRLCCLRHAATPHFVLQYSILPAHWGHVKQASAGAATPGAS
jgi:hypothetical protein